ncbi:MAG: hypothetical protein H6R22_888, partial [Chromatiaceae bacterium]|nr:hypothetical protein [Chromatiaceae bacterium]
PGPNQHPLTVVAHITQKPEIARKAPDGRAKAHPLHQTPNPDELTP